MHVHTVFFWLSPDLDDAQRTQFERGVEALIDGTEVLESHFGKPAQTSRSVVDSSYDYGLVLGFESLAAHNACQTSAVHTTFVETCQTSWTRVQVYDIDDRS